MASLIREEPRRRLIRFADPLQQHDGLLVAAGLWGVLAILSWPLAAIALAVTAIVWLTSLLDSDEPDPAARRHQHHLHADA